MVVCYALSDRCARIDSIAHELRWAPRSDFADRRYVGDFDRPQSSESIPRAGKYDFSLVCNEGPVSVNIRLTTMITQFDNRDQ